MGNVVGLRCGCGGGGTVREDLRETELLHGALLRCEIDRLGRLQRSPLNALSEVQSTSLKSVCALDSMERQRVSAAPPRLAKIFPFGQAVASPPRSWCGQGRRDARLADCSPWRSGTSTCCRRRTCTCTSPGRCARPPSPTSPRSTASGCPRPCGSTTCCARPRRAGVVPVPAAVRRRTGRRPGRGRCAASSSRRPRTTPRRGPAGSSSRSTPPRTRRSSEASRPRSRSSSTRRTRPARRPAASRDRGRRQPDPAPAGRPHAGAAGRPQRR